MDGVSLALQRGEVLGLVGESGCGKSTLARTILQLVPATEGAIVLEGRNLTAARSAEVTAARRRLQMVFQDPVRVAQSAHDRLRRPRRAHARAPGLRPAPTSPAEVAELMERVGLAPRFLRKYPHEFSGGQRQRIAVARALALRPKVIIADEPVSALDVSVQAQILNLLSQLVREMGLSLIFIAHDLSVVKHISDRVAVMYLGKIVELGRAADVIDRPRHPYTRALVSAIPAARPRCRTRPAAHRARRRPALAAASARRMRLSSALPVRGGEVQSRRAAARPGSPTAARSPASASGRFEGAGAVTLVD